MPITLHKQHMCAYLLESITLLPRKKLNLYLCWELLSMFINQQARCFFSPLLDTRVNMFVSRLVCVYVRLWLCERNCSVSMGQECSGKYVWQISWPWVHIWVFWQEPKNLTCSDLKTERLSFLKIWDAEHRWVGKHIPQASKTCA